jgi:MbtH protein
MSDWDEDPFDAYAVVVNGEEQYSIWPTVKPIPAGWKATGFQGPKAECLEHIDLIWTDIRPRSLRLRLEREAAADGAGTC